MSMGRVIFHDFRFIRWFYCEIGFLLYFRHSSHFMRMFGLFIYFCEIYIGASVEKVSKWNIRFASLFFFFNKGDYIFQMMLSVGIHWSRTRIYFFVRFANPPRNVRFYFKNWPFSLQKKKTKIDKYTHRCRNIYTFSLFHSLYLSIHCIALAVSLLLLLCLCCS